MSSQLPKTLGSQSANFLKFLYSSKNKGRSLLGLQSATAGSRLPPQRARVWVGRARSPRRRLRPPRSRSRPAPGG